MFTPIKATAISIKPKKWDKADNADKLETYFCEAAKNKPDLVLATEGMLEGYVVMDVIEHPEKTDAMLEIAEPIDGPYIGRFRRLAELLKTNLCFGFAERIDKEVYNTALFIGNDGEIYGKQHKTQLAEGTDESWNFNRVGKKIRAFDTPVGRVGILICNDRWNPRIARTQVLDGARILLIPSYGSKTREQNQMVMRRARENGVPVVNANVGMNLIISKGEVVGYAWGNDKITSAIIQVPEAVSKRAARISENEYMVLQSPEMERRYIETMKRLRGQENLVDRASRGHLVACEPKQ